MCRFTGLTDDRHPGVSAGERPEVHLPLYGKKTTRKAKRDPVMLSSPRLSINPAITPPLCDPGQTSSGVPSEPDSEGYSQSGARHVPHQWLLPGWDVRVPRCFQGGQERLDTPDPAHRQQVGKWRNVGFQLCHDRIFMWSVFFVCSGAHQERSSPS